MLKYIFNAYTKVDVHEEVRIKKQDGYDIPENI